jgi:Uma2 family endonuclease
VAVAVPHEIPLWRWSVEDYHRLGEHGFLTEDDRVELLNGALVAMTPISPAHQNAVDLLTEHFVGKGDWRVRVQGPLTFAGEDSEPQPDLALITRSRPRFAHPSTALLVVEVAVTSHAVDRGVKAPLYARAGIPEYWLVDLAAKAVEVHQQPGEGEYHELTIVRPGDELRPSAVEAPPLDVARLLSPV